MTITTTIEDLVRQVYGAGLEELEKRLPEGYEFTGEFRDAGLHEPSLPTKDAVGLGGPTFGDDLTMPRLILRRKR